MKIALGSARGYWPSFPPGTRKSTPRSSFVLVVAGRSRSESGIFFGALAEDSIASALRWRSSGLPVCADRGTPARWLAGFRVLGLVQRWRRRPGICILIILLAHALFVKALLVHLVSQPSLVLLILIVGAGIPPPVRINSAAEVRVSVAQPAAVSEAAISKGADAHAYTGTIEAAVEAARRQRLTEG